jgi:hypothetical protein
MSTGMDVVLTEDDDVFHIVMAANYFGLREDSSTYTKFHDIFSYNRSLSRLDVIGLADNAVELHLITPLLLTHGCRVVSRKHVEIGGPWQDVSLLKDVLKNYPNFEVMKFSFINAIHVNLLSNICSHQTHLKELIIEM